MHQDFKCYSQNGKQTIFIILTVYLCIQVSLAQMKWTEEVGEEMRIGPTTEGYRRVELRCGAEYMAVLIETNEDFGGVIYTRGSFGETKSGCFKDAKSGTLFNMKIPFDSCNTKKKDNVYTNTLILQHDDDLIMPGDGAFSLECDFTHPRHVPVHASIPSEVFDIVSRISLSDADPREREVPDNLKLFVKNSSNIVTFHPRLLRTKDEL